MLMPIRNVFEVMYKKHVVMMLAKLVGPFVALSKCNSKNIQFL